MPTIVLPQVLCDQLSQALFAAQMDADSNVRYVAQPLTQKFTIAYDVAGTKVNKRVQNMSREWEDIAAELWIKADACPFPGLEAHLRLLAETWGSGARKLAERSSKCQTGQWKTPSLRANALLR